VVEPAALFNHGSCTVYAFHILTVTHEVSDPKVSSSKYKLDVVLVDCFLFPCYYLDNSKKKLANHMVSYLIGIAK
jgi:hypothetical protein